jgi:hypothetical protein
MTVDQLPLLSARLYLPFLPPWTKAGGDQDRFDAEPSAVAVDPSCPDEQPVGPSGWPRIFPGL